MQVNTVTAGPYSFTVTKKANKPFSNDFTVIKAQVVQYDGKDEVACVVRCTATSREAGRLYSVQYSTAGELMECNTLN